jgi:hypothetical protein
MKLSAAERARAFDMGRRDRPLSLNPQAISLLHVDTFRSISGLVCIVSRARTGLGEGAHAQGNNIFPCKRSSVFRQNF